MSRHTRPFQVAGAEVWEGRWQKGYNSVGHLTECSPQFKAWKQSPEKAGYWSKVTQPGRGEAVLAFLCVCESSVRLALWGHPAVAQIYSLPHPHSRPPVSHTHLLDALQTVIGLLDVPIHRIHSGRFAGFYPRAMNVVQPEERGERVSLHLTTLHSLPATLPLQRWP